MPLYEYRCAECGEPFSLLRRLADRDEEIECPKCGKFHPKRLFSSFATAKGMSVSAGPASSECQSGACQWTGPSR